MSKLDQLLSGQHAPAIYRLHSRASVSHIQRVVTAHGWRLIYLDGQQISDKRSFLAACAQAMQLPAYFGHNWDALYDSMTDFADAPTAGDVLLYDHAANFAAHAPQEWALAQAVLNDAIAALHKDNRALYVLLRGTAGRVPAAPLL